MNANLSQRMKANVLFMDAKPAQEAPWTKTLWVYDLRNNQHFTIKTNPLKREHLDGFIADYRPDKRHLRKPTWSEEILDDLQSAMQQFAVVAAELAPTLADTSTSDPD